VGTGSLNLNDGSVLIAVGPADLTVPISLGGSTTIEGTANLEIDGAISGPGSLTDNNTGTFTLTGNNTYSGGTTVNSGATLAIGGTGTLPLPLGNGSLFLNDGSLLIASVRPQLFSNSVTLSGSVTIAGSNNLEIDGVISGTGSLTAADLGTLTLGATNTYSGGTNVTAGTLAVVGSSNRIGTFGTGSVTLNNGTTLFLDEGSFVATSPTFNNPLHLFGTSTIQLPGAGGNAPMLWAGLISGSGGLVVTSTSSTSSAELIFTANNTYSGPTNLGSATVAGGFLGINGNQPSSAVTINNGGVLNATGTIGALTINRGTLAVTNGTGPGILNTGNLQINAARLIFIVDSLAPGIGYSQIRVNGTVNLGAGAAILTDEGTFRPSGADKIELIDNLGGMPISGFFSGAPEGAVVTDPIFGPLQYTYKGGPTGNSMVVTAVPRFDVLGRVGSSGDWWLGSSNGSSFSNQPRGSWSASPGVTWVDVHTGDFTGTGQQDIVGRWLQTGQWWMTQSNGSGGFTNTLWDTWSTKATWVDVKIGDFNGDGKMDFIGRWKETGQWWLAQSTGSTFTNTLFDTWSTKATWVDVQVGDFNGDGKADITGRWSQGGSWWTSISGGSTGTTSQWDQWSTAVNWVNVMVGDFNGDGMADIAGRVSLTGQWWVSLSNSSNGFTHTLWDTWSTAVTWVNVMVGDFNGDGSADIVGRVSQTGQWWVSLSNGSNGFTHTLWDTWAADGPGVTWANVQVGDFNGDGKMDIAGRWLQAGSWWTAQSTGSGFMTSQWGQWSTAVNWVDVQDGFYA
jgi:autotransporter-associated beta strand protein